MTPTQMPKPFRKGLIPTLNNMGFMLERLDPYSELFVEHMARVGGGALDLGCAYGVATLAALERGAHVTACDIDPGHIEVLTHRCPAEFKSRLTCVVGAVPHVDFAHEAFDAVICARMLHFLRPDDFRLALKKIERWLKPGGKAFIVTDTVFAGPWRQKLASYTERKARGDKWPGLIEDYASVFPPGTDMTGAPTFINLMDPDILHRECTGAGFVVERAAFIDLDSPTPLDSGREGAHAGVVCLKTAASQ